MDPATKSFATAKIFRQWLERHHDLPEGIWLRIFKKASGRKTVTYAEALDEALCFGWIDGQKKALDDRSWLQRFTPRRSRSGWSKINTQHAERLIAEGRMAESGLRQINAAKADGRWNAAYDSPRNAQPPEELLQALEKNRKAKAFFATLNKSNVYAIVYRLQTAKKTETKQKRLDAILGMLEREEKFHP